MAKLIDHIAHLSASADFAALDAALAEALLDLLAPDAVTFFGMLGETDDRRWFERVLLRPGAPARVSEPLWLVLADLPGLSDAPQRLECLRTRETTTALPGAAGTPYRTLLPLQSNEQTVAVIELHSAAPLAVPVQAVFASLQRAYRNSYSLLDASGRDGLTGLHNRQAFEAIFPAAAQGTDQPAATGAAAVPVERRNSSSADAYWLGLFNIDHVAQVNAAHGHLVGDAVLVQTARLLAGTLRFYDRTYRLGGSEFVLLLRCPGKAAAGAALERLRARFAATIFAPAPVLTASAGFTALRPGDSPGAALARADRALFEAKARGRNRICCDADLPEPDNNGNALP